MIKFKVFKGINDQFYAHMAAGNGKIIWQSEGYKRVGDAHKLCRSTVEGITGSLPQYVSVEYTHDSLLPKGRK